MHIDTPQYIASLASSVRRKLHDERFPGKEYQPPHCTVLAPKFFTFNRDYTIKFADETTWICRIPHTDMDGCFSESNARLIRSEAMTMSFIRQNTSIPVPEIYDFDETSSNEINAPYILMEFMSGSLLINMWFNTTGPTPLEDRRLRVLDTVATAMTQLRQFQFNRIGSLQFDSDSLNPTNIGPLIELDQAAQLAREREDNPIEFMYRKMGPFNTSREYFEALLNMQEIPEDPFSKGIHQLLQMMIQCIPRSVSGKSDDGSESFVLAYPDLQDYSVLISEEGTLTGLIDWQNVHTVPRCIGYSRYPSWITKEWNPLIYRCVPQNVRPENSPEELEYYRRRYNEKMKMLEIEPTDFSTKSHLYEAVWIAALRPIFTDGIIKKIFLYLFPEDTQENQEHPMYLQEIAMDLAEDRLEKCVKQRILEAFQNLFSVDN